MVVSVEAAGAVRLPAQAVLVVAEVRDSVAGHHRNTVQEASVAVLEVTSGRKLKRVSAVAHLTTARRRPPVEAVAPVSAVRCSSCRALP
jgi:hypothetical protein